MKTITKGTEKQIAYATRLRNEYLATNHENTAAGEYERRLSLAIIRNIENCDDARTILDFLASPEHHVSLIVSYDEQAQIEQDIKDALARFEATHPKPKVGLPLGRHDLKRMSDEERAEYQRRTDALHQRDRAREQYLRNEGRDAA
ncbi:hypothetical protein BW13_01025 [Bifidobacterium sp. UTCIF-37]|uniref:hypothetical protein n=1 Tax=unclassified Bifidobacterium TaxID=2608897 RepID=UPI0011262A08|nr:MULTISPECIES: hypothetical protein [unclassified Bifidobacterium]TPF87462.1 hypothetical protein BW13_01025 [Bifidobacterium sp. UTCIF-37]TPF91238.1 hypothetical protein BW11_01025 [Bifidobacterium sp. UTCIF-38]